MPLVNCQDCGRDVSTRARYCVHCGSPSPIKRGGVFCAILTGSIVALMVLGGLMATRVACKKARCYRAPAVITTKAEAKPAEAPVAPQNVETPKEY